MRKVVVVLNVFLLTLILQGSGYVGDKPDISTFFSQEQVINEEVEIQEHNIERQETELEIPLPPNELEKQLAPSKIDDTNINIIKHVKKPQYVVDILSFLPRFKNFQSLVRTTSNLQNYAAKANMLDFYVQDFLAKYKSMPVSKRPIYGLIRDINNDSQSVLEAWLEAKTNSKYVSYSAFNGAYQPSVIRSKLNKLDKKLDIVVGAINDMDL